MAVAGLTFAVRLLTNDAEGSADINSNDTETTYAVEQSTAPKPPSQLGDCEKQIAVGEVLAEAAAISAENWRTHTRAEEMLESGEYTPTEAESDWQKSTSEGRSDLERFDAAQGAYVEVFGPCPTLPALQDVDPSYQSAVDDCYERGDALNNVAAWGAAVNADWAEHLDFEVTRPEQSSEDYLQEWSKQVQDATNNYEAYLAAVVAYEAAPVCDPL